MLISDIFIHEKYFGLRLSKQSKQSKQSNNMTLNEDRSLNFISEITHKAKWLIFVDGASNNSHKVSGIGIAIFKEGILNDFISEKLPLVAEDGTVGNNRIQTNNESEYQALIRALEYCVENSITDVGIYGDSKLVINQTNGEWKINKSHLIPLQKQALKLAMSIKERDVDVDAPKPRIFIRHVHREKNWFADYYSKICIGQIKDRAIVKFDSKYRF